MSGKYFAIHEMNYEKGGQQLLHNFTLTFYAFYSIFCYTKGFVFCWNSSECKKDMWIVWDNSQSLGKSAFQDQVRPFLKNLIKSPRLNVGPDGTHIGILSFSTETKTRVLVDMGEKQTQEELLALMDSLNYDALRGDGTRTGLALNMMNAVKSCFIPGVLHLFRPFQEPLL